MISGEDSKRKRESEEEQGNDRQGDVDLLKEYIQQLVEGVKQLSRTVASASNIRRDVVICASKLDTMARRLEEGKVEALIERISEGAKRKTLKSDRKTTTAEAGTQTDAIKPVWVNRKTYTKTTVKEENPLGTEAKWDLLVFRKAGDRNMDNGIQRMFRNRFGELPKVQGDVAHIKTATWVVGEEEGPPIARHVFRVEEGAMDETKKRLVEVLEKMVKCGRNMLAIAWEENHKLHEFRDMVEETLAQREIVAAIHIQPTPALKKRPERTTDAIFIKKTAGASYLDVLKNVREEVMAKGLGDVIRGVRETKGGDLMLTIDKQKQQKKDIKEALISKMGKENVRASVEKPEATVHIRDIDAATTKEEVEKVIRKELGDVGRTKKWKWSP